MYESTTWVMKYFSEASDLRDSDLYYRFIGLGYYWKWNSLKFTSVKFLLSADIGRRLTPSSSLNDKICSCYLLSLKIKFLYMGQDHKYGMKLSWLMTRKVSVQQSLVSNSPKPPGHENKAQLFHCHGLVSWTLPKLLMMSYIM